MSDPVFSTDVRPLSELKSRTSELVEQVSRSQRPMLITRRGRGVAVMLDLIAYERMREELSFGRAIDQGALQANRGEFASAVEVKNILAPARPKAASSKSPKPSKRK